MMKPFDTLETPNFKKYFFYALIIKGLFFLLFAFLFNKNAGEDDNINFIFAFSNDYGSYIEPSVNLVDHGEYYENYSEHGVPKKLYAHKMPGMMPVFAPLYAFFGFRWGLTVLVLIQYVIDALCCVLLAKTAMRILRDSRVFFITFFLYTFSSIVSVTSHFALSESLCTAFSIISLYFMTEGKTKQNFLFGGIFATCSVFLRPTSILLFVFLPLLIKPEASDKSWVKKILMNKSNILIFLLPFIVAESAWILRNYKTLNRFIPYDICIENAAPKGTLSVLELVKAIGGDLQSWNPDSEMRWFSIPGSDNYDINYANSYPFPPYVEKGGISLDELKNLRNHYYRYLDSTTTIQENFKEEKRLELLSKSLALKFKSNAPWSYYLFAPLRTFKTLLFIKRPCGFSFRSNGLLEKLVRGWHFICYYIPLLLFIFGLVWVFFKKNRNSMILFLMCFLHMLLYGFIFRYSENRYLVPIYPYLVIIASGSILVIKSWINRFNGSSRIIELS
jgi:hypothetical protein